MAIGARVQVLERQIVVCRAVVGAADIDDLGTHPRDHVEEIARDRHVDVVGDLFETDTFVLLASDVHLHVVDGDALAAGEQHGFVVEYALKLTADPHPGHHHVGARGVLDFELGRLAAHAVADHVRCEIDVGDDAFPFDTDGFAGFRVGELRAERRAQHRGRAAAVEIEHRMAGQRFAVAKQLRDLGLGVGIEHQLAIDHGRGQRAANEGTVLDLRTDADADGLCRHALGGVGRRLLHGARHVAEQFDGDRFLGTEHAALVGALDDLRVGQGFRLCVLCVECGFDLGAEIPRRRRVGDDGYGKQGEPELLHCGGSCEGR